MKDKRSAGKSTKSTAASNSKSTTKTAGRTAVAKGTAKKAAVKKTVVKKAAPARAVKKARPAPPFAISQSGIHGRGAFATRAIRKGAILTEYRGERITWEEAERRYPVDPIPYHTFLFEIGDGSYCLDAQNRRIPAKWINHSCKPNCEAEEDEDERVFIKARRAIARGEELTYDYNLTCEERMSMKDKKLRYPCWCGAKNCRETMLGKKR